MHIPRFESCRFAYFRHGRNIIWSCEEDEAVSYNADDMSVLDRRAKQKETGDRFQISCLWKGSLEITIRGQPHRFEKNSLFFLYGDPCPRTYVYPNDPQVVESYFIFHAKHLSETSRRLLASLPASMPLSKKAEYMFKAAATEDPFTPATFDDIGRKMQDGLLNVIPETDSSTDPFGTYSMRQHTHDYIWHLGNSLLSLVLSEANELYDLSAKTPPSYVEKCLTLIGTYYYRTWTLESLSTQCGVSKYYLNSLFRTSGLPSPMRCLWEKREKEAINLLANSALSNKEIAGRTGFGSGNHLYHRLRKSTGRTPEQYRNAVRR